MSTAPEPIGAPEVGPQRIPRIGTRAGDHAKTLVEGVWRHWSDAKPFVVPHRSEWSVGLRRARIAGLVLLGIQLIALCWWSSILAHRFALTRDFATAEQAIYLIAHGHLNPDSTTIGYAFWKNHAEFILWPLALLERLWPHPVTLLWIQSAAAVGAEAIAFGWICDIAAHRAKRDQAIIAPIALVALGIVLLVCNPWIVWGSSFDFHFEALAAVFAVGAARDLFLRRRRVWVWVILGLLCGDVGASYLGAVGISAAVFGRPYWRRGAAVAALGFGYLLALGAAHATKGSGADEYGVLVTGGHGPAPLDISAGTVVKSILTHPGRALSVLWSNHVDIWANLSPSGVIGLLWLPVLAPTALVLVEGGLTQSTNFSAPGFQSIAIVPLAAVGTVAVCAWFAAGSRRRRRWLFPLVGGVVVANTLAWAIVWIPEAPARWLQVSPGAAAVLKHLEARIGPNDEVVAEQGVEGAFANRASIYNLFNSSARVPVTSRKVWLIFAPGEGIEQAPASGIYADLAALSRDPAMHLVVASHGIWAFEWIPPRSAQTLTIGSSHPASAPAWAVAGPSGSAVLTGPPSSWYVAGTQQPGYVVNRAYWRKLPGSYRATATLAVSSTANLEIWNATTSQLLQRFSVPGTNGKTTIRTTVRVWRTPAEHLFRGLGPWRIQVQEPIGDQIEVRVWSPGGADAVNVYRVGLRRIRSARAASARAAPRFHARRYGIPARVGSGALGSGRLVESSVDQQALADR